MKRIQLACITPGCLTCSFFPLPISGKSLGAEDKAKVQPEWLILCRVVQRHLPEPHKHRLSSKALQSLDFFFPLGCQSMACPWWRGNSLTWWEPFSREKSAQDRHIHPPDGVQGTPKLNVKKLQVTHFRS